MSFAHCDIDNGKIFGCEPKTFTWFHEEGHLVYNSEEKTSRLNLFRGIIFDLWVVFITLTLLWKILIILPIITALLYISFGQYEELWCNKYAKNKLKEVEDGN
jgi:hypothetical protein